MSGMEMFANQPQPPNGLYSIGEPDSSHPFIPLIGPIADSTDDHGQSAREVYLRRFLASAASEHSSST
jgi:hypothetical protein